MPISGEIVDLPLLCWSSWTSSTPESRTWRRV